MITIKIPEQIIEVDSSDISEIMPASPTIYSAIATTSERDVMKKIKCEVIYPPKENFSRQEIISQAVDKINKSYHNTPLSEIKKLGIVKLVIDLGIDFDTEIKPLINNL